MVLPGGLARTDGTIDRTYRWKPVDGTVERALADAALARFRPEAISKALAGALDSIGGEPASRQRIDALSVPDRRFLMIELADALGLSFAWSTHACEACRAPFDFPLDLRALPMQPAGEHYPSTEIATSRGPVRVRVPTGADQIRIAAARDDGTAAELLAGLCVSASDDGVAVDGLSSDDLVAIEDAVELLAPKLAWAAQAPCPGCGFGNVIAIDTAGWLVSMAEGPTPEIHEIALAYGWSERDILALTRAQRLQYLALIRGDMHRN